MFISLSTGKKESCDLCFRLFRQFLADWFVPADIAARINANELVTVATGRFCRTHVAASAARAGSAISSALLSFYRFFFWKRKRPFYFFSLPPVRLTQTAPPGAPWQPKHGSPHRKCLCLQPGRRHFSAIWNKIAACISFLSSAPPRPLVSFRTSRCGRTSNVEPDNSLQIINNNNNTDDRIQEEDFMFPVWWKAAVRLCWARWWPLDQSLCATRRKVPKGETKVST